MAACFVCNSYIDHGAELAEHLASSMDSCREERAEYQAKHGDKVALEMSIGWLEGLIREAAGASIGLCQDCWEKKHGR